MQVVLAKNHRARLFEPPDDFCIFRRYVIFVQGAGGGSPSSCGIDQIFERDGNSVQRSSPLTAREFSFWEADELVGVGIADETPHSLSAVYCYHEPSRSQLSIGTYNVLQGIEYARRHRLRYVYLGYRVEGCISLQYKGRFRPQESLRGRVSEGEEPRWERA